MKHPKYKYMKKCIEIATENAKEGQYPIASLVVDGKGEIISIGKNVLLKTPDPTAHPEILAIRGAAERIKNRYIEGCVLYTTLEPCPMCTSAAIWAKMAGIVYGATQKDALDYSRRQPSDVYTWRQILIPCRYIVDRGTPKLELHEEFMREDCIALFELSLK